MKNLLPYLVIGILLLAFYFWRYRIAPDVVVESIQVSVEGKQFPLDELQEGNLLVNYYARWCGECMAEMAALEQLHKTGMVNVVGLTDDTAEEIAQVKGRYNITFPIYRLTQSLKDEGVYTIPTSYLINEKGETVKSFVGSQNWNSTEMMNNYPIWLSLQ